MRYLLAVLTCGRPAYLERTLASYARFLDPAPSALYVWDDGLATPRSAFAAFGDLEPLIEGEHVRVGRCSGHAHLWRQAAMSGYDWVFTVEDDIILLRPLNLERLRHVLVKEQELAQMALVRCPWGAEVEVGGYIPMFPGRYERRLTGKHEWIASTIDWTSSPALLPTQLTREVEWPGGRDCELELGRRILAQRPDAVSGYWGWGEPWSAHVGMSRVEGGHGY